MMQGRPPHGKARAVACGGNPRALPDLACSSSIGTADGEKPRTSSQALKPTPGSKSAVEARQNCFETAPTATRAEPPTKSQHHLLLVLSFSLLPGIDNLCLCPECQEGVLRLLNTLGGPPENMRGL